jgi:hypothetical protein
MTARIATDSRSGAAQPAPLAVAAELEAIFKPLPRPASPLPEAALPRDLPARRRHAGRWIGGLVALALIIAVASIAFLARTARAPLSRPQPVQPAHVVPPPVARQAQPRPAIPATEVAQSAVEERRPAPEAPAPATANSQGRGLAPPPRSHRERATRRPAGRCRAGATSAWCLRGAVVAADDRLRGAYAAAIRAGVDRRTLEGVRSDWSRLRRRANKEPEALIRGYGLLTQELRAEARRAERR